MYSYIRPLIEGTIWSWTIAVILFAAMLLPKTDTGLFRSNFASRYEAECIGWTKSLALHHTINDLLTWWAYIMIAFAILRKHPILDKIPMAVVAVYAAVAFFWGCGGKHLLDAHNNFRPMYVLSAWYGTYNAVASLIGAVAICISLDIAFREVTQRRKRLEERIKGA